MLFQMHMLLFFFSGTQTFFEESCHTTTVLF